MKTTDIVLIAGVALVVVVVGKRLLAPTAAVTATGSVNPTLGGVANIVGATSGLIDSIKGLVRGEPKPPQDAKVETARVSPIGRMSIDRIDEVFSFRGEAAIPRPGYALDA